MQCFLRNITNPVVTSCCFLRLHTILKLGSDSNECFLHTQNFAFNLPWQQHILALENRGSYDYNHPVLVRVVAGVLDPNLGGGILLKLLDYASGLANDAADARGVAEEAEGDIARRHIEGTAGRPVAFVGGAAVVGVRGEILHYEYGGRLSLRSKQIYIRRERFLTKTEGYCYTIRLCAKSLPVLTEG
nr:hypothetical protein Itr_chr06CG02290 [Ipomoea trifida]